MPVESLFSAIFYETMPGTAGLNMIQHWGASNWLSTLWNDSIAIRLIQCHYHIYRNNASNTQDSVLTHKTRSIDLDYKPKWNDALLQV